MGEWQQCYDIVLWFCAYLNSFLCHITVSVIKMSLLRQFTIHIAGNNVLVKTGQPLMNEVICEAGLQTYFMFYIFFVLFYIQRKINYSFQVILFNVCLPAFSESGHQAWFYNLCLYFTTRWQWCEKPKGYLTFVALRCVAETRLHKELEYFFFFFFF